MHDISLVLHQNFRLALFALHHRHEIEHFSFVYVTAMISVCEPSVSDRTHYAEKLQR